ncbi:hypothetical protein J4205_04185 [Candidatus Pacearchaeota archaeon]|nr:hypothetical protein [Candidatus Pacearchaeota archaeon]
MKPINLLDGIVIIAVVALGSLPLIGYLRYNNLYNKAEAYAIQQFGDRQPPLTGRERQRWYHEMNIFDNRQPTKPELNKFLDDKI